MDVEKRCLPGRQDTGDVWQERKGSLASKFPLSLAGANHPFMAQGSRENEAGSVATRKCGDVRALCDALPGHQGLRGRDNLSAHVSQPVPWLRGRRRLLRVPGRSCCPVTSQPAGGRSATLYPFPPGRNHHLSSLGLTLTLHVDLPACLPCFCQCHQPSVSIHQRQPMNHQVAHFTAGTCGPRSVLTSPLASSCLVPATAGHTEWWECLLPAGFSPGCEIQVLSHRMLMLPNNGSRNQGKWWWQWPPD